MSNKFLTKDIDSKIEINEVNNLQSILNSKLDILNSIDVDSIITSFSLKADKIDTNLALDLKANIIDTNLALDLKANIIDTNSALNLKANESFTIQSLNLKANKVDAFSLSNIGNTIINTGTIQLPIINVNSNLIVHNLTSNTLLSFNGNITTFSSSTAEILGLNSNFITTNNMRVNNNLTADSLNSSTFAADSIGVGTIVCNSAVINSALKSQTFDTTIIKADLLHFPPQSHPNGTWLSSGNNTVPILWSGIYPSTTNINDPFPQVFTSPVGHGFLSTSVNTFKQIYKNDNNNDIQVATETDLNGTVFFGDKIGTATANTHPRIVIGRTTNYDRGIRIGGWKDRTGIDTHHSCIQTSENLHIDSATESLIYMNFWNIKPVVFGSHVLPANTLCDIGDPNVRFKDIYLTNQPSVTSDFEMKQDIFELTETEIQVGILLSNMIRTYRLKSSVLLKGTEARIHTGFIAQEVEQIIIDAGLDPMKYGFLIKSPIYTIDGKHSNEENQKIYTKDTPNVVTSYRYSLRYCELQAFITGALHSKLNEFNNRLERLENK
jgi:hypothetical protein